jgi:thiamine biosynthesis lipoprotein
METPAAPRIATDRRTLPELSMPFRLPVFAWLIVAAALMTPNARLGAEEFVFRREHLLGTSLEFRVFSQDQATAKSSYDAALAEIERCSRIYSTYDPQSEASRWMTGELVAVSSELADLLKSCDRWRELSRGAFDVSVGEASASWAEAARTGQPPTNESLTQVIRKIAAPDWRFDNGGSRCERLSASTLNFDAIAKGLILDQASEAAATTPGVEGVLIAIGGDIRVRGRMDHLIAVTDPLHTAENAHPLQTVRLSKGGLATSGGSRRGFRVGEQWFSHIIDPWTARPVAHVEQATVIAASAADADALATICNVLEPSESLRLIEDIPGASCLIVAASGETFASRGWKGSPATQTVAAEDETRPGTKTDEPVKVELLQLTINFELTMRPKYDYNRPYVAIWLEDDKGKPVRTALLWIEAKDPGPQWHKDLIRWYRNDQARRRDDELNLIATKSGPTRGPGKYKAVFDGTDDHTRPLKPGPYTLYLEAVREHGEYELTRQPLKLGREPIARTELKANEEFAAIAYTYAKPAVRTQNAPNETGDSQTD